MKVNHPLRFSVFEVGSRLAVFAFEREACDFARTISARYFTRTEVLLTRGKGKGLIAQYYKGEPASEFSLHERLRMEAA